MNWRNYWKPAVALVVVLAMLGLMAWLLTPSKKTPPAAAKPAAIESASEAATPAAPPATKTKGRGVVTQSPKKTSPAATTSKAAGAPLPAPAVVNNYYYSTPLPSGAAHLASAIATPPINNDNKNENTNIVIINGETYSPEKRKKGGGKKTIGGAEVELEVAMEAPPAGCPPNRIFILERKVVPGGDPRLHDAAGYWIPGHYEEIRECVMGKEKTYQRWIAHPIPGT